MTHRDNIEVKTKYKTKAECINDCKKLGRDKFWNKVTMSKKIVGIVNDDGTFKLSTKDKLGSVHQFTGHLVARASGVYLTGNISIKQRYGVFFHFTNIVMNVIGLVLINMIPMNDPDALTIKFIACIIIATGWFHVWYLYKSNTLYNNLIKWFS